MIESNPVMLALAAVLTLIAIAFVVRPLWSSQSGGSSRPLAIALLLLIPAAAAGLYGALSSYPYRSQELLAERPIEQFDPAELIKLIQELRQQVEAEPSVEGWVMLAQGYYQLELYAESANAWRNASVLDGARNAQILIGYAEALVLADSNSLTGEAGNLLDAALALEPDDPRGLWYGGLSAANRNQPELAAQRWSALLANPDLPEPLRAVVQQQLVALAEQPLPPGERPAQDSDSRQIEVRVNVAADLEDRLQPGQTLFVFLRGADGAGPPLAVKRVANPRLPLAIMLTDADVMLAGNRLPAVSTGLQLTARLSASGDAMAASGDLYGTADLQPAGAESLSTAVEVVINRIQD